VESVGRGTARGMAMPNDPFHQPDPTGTVHDWWINPDQFDPLMQLLREINNAKEWQDVEMLELAKERLTQMDGFPRMQPGDHLRVRVRPPIVAVGGPMPSIAYIRKGN
jgi:hypothetical protein